MKLKFKTRIFLFFSGLILFLGAFWWGMDFLGRNLEDFFLWKITNCQEIFPATIGPANLQEAAERLPKRLKPIRNWEIEDLEIDARSVIALEISQKDKKEKILFKKNISQKLPIASLTKLMTASVVLENYNLSHLLEISEEAVLQEGEQGELKVGEVLSVKDLLYIMLIESSNDAAYALSQVIGNQPFIELMNEKAKRIGLENTYFGNVTGLDPTNPTDLINYSTVEDLTKLTEELLKNQPLIWEILSLKEFELYRPDGSFHHKLENTNELLKEVPFSIDGREMKIVGGKTGWTPKSNGCLLLVLESTPLHQIMDNKGTSRQKFEDKSYLIYIILGSDNKFKEMKELINWTDEAYSW